MLTFAVEPLEKCWAEFYILARQQWDETEAHIYGDTYNPLFERYNQYAKSGWFVMVVARDKGEMVGYAGVYIVPSMHSQEIISTEDTWFLRKDYRKGRNALNLFKFTEAECVRRGAKVAIGTVNRMNGADRLLTYLGYEETARVFTKKLTGEVHVRAIAAAVA